MPKMIKFGVLAGTCILLSLNSTVFAIDTKPEVETVSQVVDTITSDMPLGQSADGEVSLLPEDVGAIDEAEEDGLFGLEGGYFHPYISLDFEYTDNLYNIDKGKTENLLTQISPGIWMALPRKKVVPVTINPNNSSPGGLQYQFEDYVGTDRFQFYALGGMDFKFYSEDGNQDSIEGFDGETIEFTEDLDTINYLIEGMARWNLRGGLALQLVDRYTHNNDILEIGAIERNFFRDFDSNFFMGTADWQITEKFRLQLDYFNFFLGYDDEINQYLDRMDNGINLYGYFNLTLQTAFFVQYKYVDVAYDESELINNTSQFFYGGVKWDTTEKLTALFKFGYQDKKFENNDQGQEDKDGYVFDLQLTYRMFEKTIFDLDMYRTNEETDFYRASDKTVTGATFRFTQNFFERWSARLDAYYEFSEYSIFHLVDQQDRDDEIFQIRPSVQYRFRDWLMFELAYEYETRDSTEDYYDYKTNTILLNANLAF